MFAYGAAVARRFHSKPLVVTVVVGLVVALAVVLGVFVLSSVLGVTVVALVAVLVVAASTVVGRRHGRHGRHGHAGIGRRWGLLRGRGRLGGWLLGLRGWLRLLRLGW